jgi:hypothetical protein
MVVSSPRMEEKSLGVLATELFGADNDGESAH